MNNLKIKRIYDAPADDDGIRVLVDDLWPRGISKERACIDHWLKEIAPSSTLRTWYGHDIKKWGTFKSRYFKELSELKEQTNELRTLLKGSDVTLLYSARTDELNNAVALAEFLLSRQSSN